MPEKPPYTQDELERYFRDPSARRGADPNGHGNRHRATRPQSGVRGYFYRRFDDPRKAQAALVLSLLLGLALVGTLIAGIYIALLTDDIPPFSALDNPDLQLATVAYTADGKELARYAFQNRSWVTYDQISPHVLNALVATEDRRFYDHWGIDMRGIMTAVVEAFIKFDVRGASTITQQLARNLYNKEIGREVTISRKVKEMITAVQLERRYTKREIIEMYLNTVEYVYNAFGIEAAARTFFNTTAAELDPLQAATLVGMLQNPSLNNPVRFPENARERRNTALSQMVKYGYLSQDFYDEHAAEPIEVDFNSSDITASFAPYFAEYVRNWMREWARENDVDFYAEGLVVYTTLDSRLQELAQAAVQEQMEGLQAVVDYEWSRPSGISLGTTTEAYTKATGYEPFKYFWESKQDLTTSFIRETPHFKNLRKAGISADQALAQLRGDEAFFDSLRAEKTRLEAGLVSIDPQNGYVKAWVGGRNLADDWFDHVAIAKRQPGSTFKPFVYTAAIDNGYSPYYTLLDDTLTYVDEAGNVWRPGNSGGGSTGQMMTLRDALAMSKNLVTARLVLQIGANNLAFYARRMGVKSELEEVPALALGVSDVTLLEMTSAYSTLASGGLHYEPTIITRIEDRFGNMLYEATPAPEEALSEETAYTVVDMLRGSIQHPLGTASRVRWQFGLGDYDLAAKTGTTQNSADGWFMIMHPSLVTGAWVGFNDRRVTFRTNFWGQGAHNALFLAGDFLNAAAEADLLTDERFPRPEEFGLSYERPDTTSQQRDNDENRRRRVGW